MNIGEKDENEEEEDEEEDWDEEKEKNEDQKKDEGENEKEMSRNKFLCFLPSFIFFAFPSLFIQPILSFLFSLFSIIFFVLSIPL